MKTILIILICLLSIGPVQAQNAKTERIKAIRSAYAAAKKKISENGKNGKSPKDMRVSFNDVTDEEAEVYENSHLDFYFDEPVDQDGNTQKKPYFIIENWECHGHTRYREMLINPKDSSLMFSYIKGEADGGFVVESRFYFDAGGRLIEEKHNTSNTWYNGDGEKADAKRFISIFKMLNNNDYTTPLDNDVPKKPTTPKAQRLKHIRDLYAKSKDRMVQNNKAEARRDIRVTIHDLGEDQPPRTTDIMIYFDTKNNQSKPDDYSVSNYCYFITHHATSMSSDGYGEYLFEPMSNKLIFSYSRGKEEGQVVEWRYYFDENGKCIETKSNSDELDDGFYDKRAAKDYVKIMETILQE